MSTLKAAIALSAARRCGVKLATIKNARMSRRQLTGLSGPSCCKVLKVALSRSPRLGETPEQIRHDVDECVGRTPECILDVLDSASDAANATASHLRSNWQDEKSAKQWEKIARTIDKARNKVKSELPF